LGNVIDDEGLSQIMKYVNNLFAPLTLLLPILLFAGSCSAIGDIFQAGMGVGIFLVVLIIGFVIFIVSRFGKSKK